MLDKFYRRELDIRPGDALRCKVDFETSYGPDHEVLAERYRIVEIFEVLPAPRPSNEQLRRRGRRARARRSRPRSSKRGLLALQFRPNIAALQHSLASGVNDRHIQGNGALL